MFLPKEIHENTLASCRKNDIQVNLMIKNENMIPLPGTLSKHDRLVSVVSFRGVNTEEERNT